MQTGGCTACVFVRTLYASCHTWMGDVHRAHMVCIFCMQRVSGVWISCAVLSHALYVHVCICACTVSHHACVYCGRCVHWPWPRIVRVQGLRDVVLRRVRAPHRVRAHGLRSCVSNPTLFVCSFGFLKKFLQFAFSCGILLLIDYC